MIDKKIKEWLTSKEIKDLTSVQKKSIPLITQGKNVLITAPTGYGKTLSAIIPVFQKIQNNKQGLKIIYIAPTKSLNRDIFKRIMEFAKHLDLTIDIRYGDTTSYQRRKQTLNPPSILITTPESLQSMFISEKMRENMKDIEYVIIDEIHELVSSKRGVQLTLGLERLNQITNFKRIGISATISDMDEVGKFMCGNRDYEIVNISEPKESHIKVIKSDNSTKNEELAKKTGISNQLINTIIKMKQELDNSKRAIIFVNTRQQSEILSFSMKKLYPELKIGLHHSSLSKKQRIQTEDDLRQGKLKAIIATSSMELGIDVGSIDLVIQFMSPRQVNKLVQRIGRSGHAYYKKSKGIIFTLNSDDYLESLSIKDLLKQGFLEKPLIPKNSLDVLAHQIIGFLKDNPNLKKTKLLQLINNSYCFDISTIEFDSFLNFMQELRYIKVEKEIIIVQNKSFFYYFRNVSTIPDLKNYKIFNIETKSRLGTLDESFVSQYCNPGSEIIMKGETWQVLEVDEETVRVARAKTSQAAVPSWTGELIPVSKEIAIKVGDYRHELFSKEKIIPDSKSIMIENTNENIIIHSCFGSRINDAISMAITSVLSARIGYNIGAKTDPYRIILTIPKTVGFKVFKEILASIKPEMITDLIKLSLKNSTIFHMRFFNVAQRFGIIKKGAEYIGQKMKKIIEYYQGSYIFKETMNEIIREKMDLGGAIEVLKTRKIVYVNENKLSKFAIQGLNYGGFNGIMLKGKDDKEIIDLVKKRLLEKRFKFKCYNCKTNLGTFQVQSFPYLKCPKCEAKTIGFLEPSREEDETFFEESSNLFLSYGKMAAFVVAGYGVGINNAKRILSLNKSPDNLVLDVIEEEKKFIRTRRFWS